MIKAVATYENAGEEALKWKLIDEARGPVDL